MQDCAGCQNAFILHIGGQIQFYEKNYSTDSQTEIVYAKDLTIIDIMHEAEEGSLQEGTSPPQDPMGS
jgi:hypothetical protein